MNLGQLLEAHLGLAAKKLNIKVALPVFEQISEDKIIEKMKEAGVPVSGKSTLYDGRTGEAFERTDCGWRRIHHETYPHG